LTGNILLEMSIATKETVAYVTQCEVFHLPW